MGTDTAPRVTEVKWLGGRTYLVEDFRDKPGPWAFLVTDEDRTSQMRVLKGTDLETEITELLISKSWG